MRTITFFLLLISYAFGATFNVNSASQLRQALADAATNGENDTIVLEPGVYRVTDDGIGTFSYQSSEEYNLTIMGNSDYARKTIILDGANKYQILNIQNQKPFTLHLKHLTIVNAKTYGLGGGVHTNGDIFIEDCDISSNTANSAAGFYTSSFALIKDSIIANNKAEGYLGGGGVAGGFAAAKAKIINSIFSNNIAKFGNGGGFVVSSANILDSFFSFNSAHQNGGGFFANEAQVIRSKFSHNDAFAGAGYYANSSTFIKDTNFSDNKALKFGGALFTSQATVVTSRFESDSAQMGGGIFAQEAKVVSSAFLQNRADNNLSAGGGIAVTKDFLSINNTFVDSSITAHGSFVNNIFVDSEILLNGKAKLLSNYIDENKIVSNGYEIAKSDNLDPIMVGDIQLSTDNITLLSNSPAIDAGVNPDSETFKSIFNNQSEYQDVLNLLQKDILGYKRVINGSIDLGAMEFGGSAIANGAPEIFIHLHEPLKTYIPNIIRFSIEAPHGVKELYISNGFKYLKLDTMQREFRVVYDKPGEYVFGIKVVDKQDYIMESFRKFSVVDPNPQEAIEYGKKLCQEDPASCGIDTSTQPEIVVITPKEQVVNVLAQQATFPVAGYFIHYNDPNSLNPLFDWVFVTPNTHVYKLQGLKSNGQFSWSEDLSSAFSSVTVSSDGKTVTFSK